MDGPWQDSYDYNLTGLKMWKKIPSLISCFLFLFQQIHWNLILFFLIFVIGFLHYILEVGLCIFYVYA